jgi:glycosyltransferase involved in cell wall biosynthesis
MSDVRRTILILTQVYVPDTASVGQHMADAAAEMARRGWRVVVLTSGRGYHDPGVRYPRREIRDGVEVIRLPFASFGVRTLPIRLAGAFLFVTQALSRGLFLRGLASILVSTSPPIAPLAALGIAAVRRVPVTYWLMDLNPDQAVALGRVSPRSVFVRLFDAMNRWIVARARRIVVLDDSMAARLAEKGDLGDKAVVLPPWPHTDVPEGVPHGDNPFRDEHGLQDAFVVMYSGNHSPSHPVTTVLRAAERLADEPSLRFVFVGGGRAKGEVDRVVASGARNVVSLPYQPLDRIRYSLSAADVHLVAVGDDMVGIVHPCKVYGAMAVGRPVLLLGPDASPTGSLVREHRIGWTVAHGDVEGAVTTIRRILATDRSELEEMGRRARRAVSEKYSRELLRSRFCDILESEATERSASRRAAL